MSRSSGKRVPLRQVARTFADCKPLFFAMGDSTRQQIILALERTEELNVSQLADRLPLSRPAISHHLKVLRQTGLVDIRRQGTEHFYFLTIDAALERLKRFVHEVENCAT